MNEVDITRSNDDVVMGWLGRISIAIWRTAPDEAVEWFRQDIERGKTKFGKGLVHVPVLGPSTPPWSPKARAGLMAVVKDNEPYIDLIVPIMTATGFMAATMRAMGAGMLMLLPRSRTQIKIVGNNEDAARIIMANVPDHQPAVTAALLTEVFAEMDRSKRAAA